MKIYVSSDHAGFMLRGKLVKYLRDRGFDVDDRGPAEPDPIDYPDEALRVGRLVQRDPTARGLLVCGSGIGVCMAANKLRGIRAASAWNVDSARLSRAHNDANVLCLGERMTAEADAFAMVEAWLATPFEGGRHARRLNKIAAIESEG